MFPVSMAAARKSLVAGIVSVPAIPEEMRGRKTRRDVICRIDANGPGRDCMVSTDALISNVEATLAKMQASLDRLNADVEEECESYKFPELFDEGPRAA
jgi:hypothetical protein